jgi:hypothetical protein
MDTFLIFSVWHGKFLSRDGRLGCRAGTSLCVLTCDNIADTLWIKRFTFHYWAFIKLHKSMPRQMQAKKNKQIRSNYFLRNIFSSSIIINWLEMNLHLNKWTFLKEKTFFLSYMVIKWFKMMPRALVCGVFPTKLCLIMMTQLFWCSSKWRHMCKKQ